MIIKSFFSILRNEKFIYEINITLVTKWSVINVKKRVISNIKNDKTNVNHKVKIFVDKIFCKGCSICIEVCPTRVFELSEDLGEKGVHYPVPLNIEKCTLCRRCELMCPDFAIAVEGQEEVV
jgi:2-oxoglutarate ferredoxin oxidoreductase subunit delta